MKDITFFYVPEVGQDLTTGKIFEVLRPKIPIRLSINHNVSRILVDCLFDTGADRNLFPAAWGRSLGYKIVTEADFTDENNTPLLSRDGFMNKFGDIIINEKKKFVKLSFL